MPTNSRGDDVELINDDSGFLHHQPIRWPHIRKTELHSNSADVTGQRLRDYLRAMGLPMALAEQWRGHVQHGEENAAQVFSRLRLLISDHWRENAEVTQSSITDASAMTRLCYWLEPGHMQGPPWLRNLFDTPPIHRRSMAPEGWDD